MTEIDPEIVQTVTEAKSGFGLRERLNGRPFRTDDIIIFIDEPTGDLLGGATDKLDPKFGFVTGRIRSGVIGEIDALAGVDTEEARKELVRLEKRKKALLKTLHETAWVFSLHGVPDIVVEGYKRETRTSLGIKGSVVPDEQDENYNAGFTARLFDAIILNVHDNRDGADSGKLGYEEAKDLSGFLPKSEYQRLSRKIAELQFKETVSESVTASADF